MRAPVYTTALKLLQIMTDKGLVKRNDENRAHVYHAAMRKDEVEESLLMKMVYTAFGGSVGKLALRALGASKASREELAEIRKMIDALEKKGGRP